MTGMLVAHTNYATTLELRLVIKYFTHTAQSKRQQSSQKQGKVIQ